MHYSTLGRHYPVLVYSSHFLQHVLSQSHNELQSPENKHYCLYQFLVRRPELNAGIRLLPLLVEFYRWVHNHLSFLVTREQSTQFSIGKTLETFLDKNYQGFKDQLMSKFHQLIGKLIVLSDSGSPLSAVLCVSVCGKSIIGFTCSSACQYIILCNSVSPPDFVTWLGQMESSSPLLERL